MYSAIVLCRQSAVIGKYWLGAPRPLTLQTVAQKHAAFPAQINQMPGLRHVQTTSNPKEPRDFKKNL